MFEPCVAFFLAPLIIARRHRRRNSFSTALHRRLSCKCNGCDDAKDDVNDDDEDTAQRHQHHGWNRRDFMARNSWAAAALTLGETIGMTTTQPDRADAALAKTEDTMTQQQHPQPYSSVRRYRAVTLANGMKVVLVSDKTAAAGSSSSAALTIRGAGQFSDPPNLNGLAHLMEHMTLSSGTRTTTTTTTSRNDKRRKGGDFEEWLNDDYADGFSNGFTAYEKVCFHFQCRTEAFAEALERFARLFQQDVMEKTCKGSSNISAFKREIRRIDAELDRTDLFSRELYLTKSLINPQHPYARMTMGSLDTLERLPSEMDIDVGDALFEFFQRHYQPRRAILVLVSSLSLASMESLVAPFATSLSKRAPLTKDEHQRIFPPFLLPSGRLNGQTSSKPGRSTAGPRGYSNTFCIFRRQNSNEILGETLEKLSFQWALDQDYSDLWREESATTHTNVVTATQIGFVLAQILGRRGPGSLCDLLKRRKWIPDGIQAVPRISFPVDISGFQLLRLELTLTLEGFANRASVIAAVYESINSVVNASPPLSRELIAQYCAVAELYGHVLAPRPPDAIELSFDGQVYGVVGPRGVANLEWRLLPSPQESAEVRCLQQTVLAVLRKIRDPTKTILITTASQRAIQYALGQNAFREPPFPLFSPASWSISPVTGARYFSDRAFRRSGKATDWLEAKLLMKYQVDPPFLNPLIPPSIRPPRMISSTLGGGLRQDEMVTIENAYKNNLQQFATFQPPNDISDDPTKTSIMRDYWALLQVYPHNHELFTSFKLPRTAPEPSARSVFVLQFLSSRPPRANSKMAADAEVWKISLEYALSDLAELGAPAGLFYEISFNKFGMRVAFLGLSQNIASYARRVSRRVIDHQRKLLEGSEKLSETVLEASRRNVNRFRMSPQRRTVLLNILKETSATDAALEGISFFKSCSGAVCLAQGDLMPSEALQLLADLKAIYKQVTGTNVSPSPAIPQPQDMLYPATWIPRSASVCTVPGSGLICNACGRVPR